MKFTVVFPSHESSDLSIGAVFKPCLVWVEGEREILNPHPSNPHYLAGDLQNLFKNTGIGKRIAGYINQVTVIVHSTGHGTYEYLALLMKDLRAEGFHVQIVYQ
ncbi:hypothetical protein [Lamprobacter modestohalophilus]|uniref:hypothetical protein n=1 Tax=Lamprobacter modestohalophilus TaxID=1064514 RepID=UPI00190600BC|nr:hypothetical protein [Lamprobacter modestohalophilus]